MNGKSTSSRSLLRRDTTSQSSRSFFIADNIPIFQYSGPSDSSPWTAGYALQSDGYDETLHISALSNSTISFNISASALTFLIGSIPSCQSTLSINASTPIPACATTSSSGDVPFSLYNLPPGTHNIEWNSGPLATSSEVIFWGVVGQRPVEKSGMTNVTIDDTYTEDGLVDVTYQGDWVHLTSGMGSGSSEAGGLGGDFNKSLAITQKQGSSVTFSGIGSAVYLYGTVGPDYGSASVNVNGKVVAPALNLTSPWAMPYQLLWFQTDLDPSSASNITLSNLENSKMALDFVILTADSSTVSTLDTSSGSQPLLSTLLGKLIAFLIIPFCVLLFLGLGIFFFCIRRRDVKRRRANKRDSVVSLYNTRPKHNPSQRPPFGDAEKRESDWSTASGPGKDGEVFVSYDQGLGQRMSDRWLSPTSPRRHDGSEYASEAGHSTGSHGNGSRAISPRSRNNLPALPESDTNSPTDNSLGTWTRPFNTLFGSNYTASEASPTRSRRGTNLPPYTPGENGTYDSTGALPDHFPTAEQEKAAQLHRANTGPSRSSDRPRLPRPLSSTAPSEIISIFGAPPSIRRASDATSIEPFPAHLVSHLVSVSNRPQPTVDTNFHIRQRSNDSPASSQQANSAAPLLRHDHGRVNPFEGRNGGGYTLQERWADEEDGERERDRDSVGGYTRGSRSVGSVGSVARPDSEVIPFDTFLNGLRRDEVSA